MKAIAKQSTNQKQHSGNCSVRCNRRLRVPVAAAAFHGFPQAEERTALPGGTEHLRGKINNIARAIAWPRISTRGNATTTQDMLRAMRVPKREPEQHKRKQGIKQNRDVNPKRLSNVFKEAEAVELQTMTVKHGQPDLWVTEADEGGPRRGSDACPPGGSKSRATQAIQTMPMVENKTADKRCGVPRSNASATKQGFSWRQLPSN